MITMNTYIYIYLCHHKYIMSRVVALVSSTKKKHIYGRVKELNFRMSTIGATQGGDTGTIGGIVEGTVVGPYGIHGSHGASGEKGMTGIMAVVGFTGPSGNAGNQGYDGPHPEFIGPRGHQGDSGYTGNRGSNDNQGMLGKPGNTGESGTTGYSGITGLTGELGLVGDNGFIGVSGDLGENGKNGIQGPTGFNGNDGRRGATGAVGITGFPGPTGFNGNDGQRGATGSVGITGMNGGVGFTGDVGLNGLIGSVGITGMNGGVGLTGDVGLNGLNGEVGLTGPIGPEGHIGGNGLTGHDGKGFTGITGFTGLGGGKSPAGLTGATGSVGDSNPGEIGVTGSVGSTGPKGDLYTLQINNLQILTGKMYKTNDTLVLDGDYVNNGGFTSITQTKIGNRTLDYPVPSNGTLFGTSNSGANMMCSADGRYVSLCASGCVYVSNNFGNTFTLNTFDSVIYAIAVSSSGKYQCCVSTGVPKACINVSNNFGVTWTETLVTGSAYDKWLTSVSISPSGKYIYCSGGGGSIMTNWSSNNFGVTFSAGGSSQIKTTSSVNDTGKVVSITSVGRYWITDLAVSITELTRGVLSTTTGQYFVSMKQFGPGYVSVGPAGFVYNPLPAGSVTTLTTRTTPEIFQQAQIIFGDKIWARSSNTIYNSTNFGVSWTKIYYSPVPIRTMYITFNSKTMYILLINGDVIRTTIYLPPTRIIGSKNYFYYPAPYSLLNYGLMARPNTYNMPIGKWILTYGFKMGSTNSTGDCTNSMIQHGIGTVGGQFEYLSNYSRYGITFGDTSTNQVFSDTFIMENSFITPIEIQINLLNSPVGGSTSAFIYDTFLETKFISM